MAAFAEKNMLRKEKAARELQELNECDDWSSAWAEVQAAGNSLILL
jgi:hypothetical protein